MDRDQSGNMEGTSPCSPPKFSRYRSVRATRAKAASEPQPPPPPLPLSVEQSSDLTRAPSRYRRNRAATNVEAAPPLPTVSPLRPEKRRDERQATQKHNIDEIVQPPPARSDDRRHVRAHSTDQHALPPPKHIKEAGRTNTTKSDSTRPLTQPKTYDAAREEARMILEGEFDRMQKLKERQGQQQMHSGSRAPDMRRRPTAAKDSNPEPVMEETEKQKTPPRAIRKPKLPTPVKETEPEPEHKSPPIRKIRQFIIGGGAHGPPQMHKQEEKAQHSRKMSMTANVEKSQAPAPAPKPALVVPAVPVSEAVRAFDAPISAVNAGDRRVEVKCNQAAITLPVTPSTTVKDLLNSASVVMSEHVDPKTAVLVEVFSYLGLERPLRRYERIRDVMNSWNSDSQHHLLIMAESECSAPGLDVKDAPSAAPLEVLVQMHHSSGPGRWDKRWIRLREDGQVTISKNESGKESTNICHLSDFDLYTPTAKQKKKLRTPKKICFAVKSQQKAAMFLEGQNFAHFFCSNQRDVADRWYKALHFWRSWYLVNVLGEGQRQGPEPRMFSLDERRPSTAQSQETMPYQLGSFKPLLDFSDHAFGGEKEPREKENAGRTSLDIGPRGPKRLPRTHGAPPSSFPRHLASNSVDHNLAENEENQAFTGTGLLARSASRRSHGGRGVAGSKGKPLVDLSAGSEFADGSLLRKLEAWDIQNGENEPIIDREKRVEAKVRVGEGS